MYFYRKVISLRRSDNEVNSSETFRRTLTALENDPNVQIMKQYSQHRGNNTFQHCVNVARCSFYLAQKLHWHVDEVSLATGAMLHDYYLYCATDPGVNKGRHAVKHPVTALANAEQIWELNDREKNIIRSHMFPLPVNRMPMYREAWLVSFADKYCAIREAMSSGSDMDIHPGDKTPWVINFFRNVFA